MGVGGGGAKGCGEGGVRQRHTAHDTDPLHKIS